MHSKVFSASCGNTPYGVTTFEADGMAQYTKNSISLEENMAFILN